MSIFACSLLPLHALGIPQELHNLSFFSDVNDYFNEGDKGKEKNPKKSILFAYFYYIRFLFSF